MLAADTGAFAHELYDFLRTIDRTGSEGAPTLKARAEQMREWCRRLAEHASAPDESASAVGRSMHALGLTFEQLGARLGKDGPTRRTFSWFRTVAAPQYETLAARLRAMRVDAPTLRPSNFARNAYHVASGLFAVACIELFPWTWVRVLAGVFVAFAWATEIGRRRSTLWHAFAQRLFGAVVHPHEEHRVTSATWFATALFVLAMLGEPVTGLLGVLALAIGDPAAAIVGRRFGRIRLVAGRSVEGTVAFAAFAFTACLAALALFHGELPANLRLVLALVAGVVGAAIELFTRHIDDNFTIPVGVAIASTVVLALA